MVFGFIIKRPLSLTRLSLKCIKLESKLQSGLYSHPAIMVQGMVGIMKMCARVCVCTHVRSMISTMGQRPTNVEMNILIDDSCWVKMVGL